MRSEKYTGKKAQAYTVLKNSFNIINEKKKENPVQTMIKALEHSAPRAEVVSLRYGGIRVYSGVDVSPTRRIDTAIRNLCIGALSSAKKQKSIEKALIGGDDYELCFTVPKIRQNEFNLLTQSIKEIEYTYICEITS